MSDDELLARAPFDPADWLTDQLLDQLGAPWDVVPVGLPPVAGAQLPDVDFPDPTSFFRDLFGRASDLGDQLGEFIADALAALWDDFVWPLLGGAVRWVWNGMVWIVTDLRNKVLDVGENVITGARWLVEWLWDLARDGFTNTLTGARWLVEWLWDLTRDAIGNAITGTRLLVEWLWDQVSAMGGNIISGVTWTADWLWERVQDAAANTVTGVRWLIEWLYEQTRGLVVAGAQLIATPFQLAFDWFRDNVVRPVFDSFETKALIPFRLIRGEYASVEDLLDDVFDPLPAALGAFALPLFIVGMLVAIFSPLIQPVAHELVQPAVQRVRARVETNLPAVGQIMEGRNRQLVDAGNMHAWLRRLGFGAEQRELFDGLRHELPPPSDLIRFAVREVFDPVLSETLSLYDDFPERFNLIMQYQGYGPSAVGPDAAQGPLPGRSWAEAYWAAHWDLPSPTQGFEMLHRQVRFGADGHVFNEQDLRLLLRALDVAPVWREPLTQIAYNPITRVDIRRMYAAGILTYDQVVERYQHLGYTQPDAVVLANFAVSLAEPEVDDPFERQRKELTDVIRRAYKRRTIDREEAVDQLVNAGLTDAEADFSLTVDDVHLALNPLDEAEPGTRDLTTATIVKAYRLGLFDRAAAQRELEVLGYLPGSAELQLALVDFERAQDLTELQVDVVKERFLSNSISRETAVEQLTALGVEGGRQFEVLVRWELERDRPNRRLTPAEVLEAWERGIFDNDAVIAELRALGYSDRDALVKVALKLPQETT